MNLEPGWEVYFGPTGNRNQFLIEVMNVVPDGSHLEVADHHIQSVPDLCEFVHRSQPGGWFQKATCTWSPKLLGGGLHRRHDHRYGFIPEPEVPHSARSLGDAKLREDGGGN